MEIIVEINNVKIILVMYNVMINVIGQDHIVLKSYVKYLQEKNNVMEHMMMVHVIGIINNVLD